MGRFQDVCTFLSLVAEDFHLQIQRACEGVLDCVGEMTIQEPGSDSAQYGEEKKQPDEEVHVSGNAREAALSCFKKAAELEVKMTDLDQGSQQESEQPVEYEALNRVMIRSYAKGDRLVCLGFPRLEDAFLRGHRFGNTEYANLKRRGKLPKLPADLRRFKSQKAKDYFMELWEGGFELDWKQSDGDESEQYAHGLLLCVVAQATDKVNISGMHSEIDPPGKYTLVLRLSCVFGEKILREIEQYALGNVYSSIQLRALSIRILHRFYRSNACHLSEFNLRNIFGFLASEYKIIQNDHFRERIDVYMVKVDMDLFYQFGTMSGETVMAFHHLVLVYMSIHRYERAAILFEELGRLRKLICPEGCDFPSEHEAWELAGIAHKRSGHFSDAERCFLRALWIELSRTSEAQWAVGSDILGTLQGLVKLYATPHVVDTLLKTGMITEGEAPNVRSLDERLHPILDGLVEVIKDNALSHSPSVLRQIKNKYTATQASATKALKVALGFQGENASPPTVESFRKKLLSYRKAKRSTSHFELANPYDDILYLGIERDYQTPFSDWVHSEQCHNCREDFPTGTICFCPCKTVGYCSKKCRKN